MKLELDPLRSGHRIDGYGPEGVRIDGTCYNKALAVMQQRLLLEWSAPPLASMTLADLTVILEWQPEIILLGTGAQQVFPPVAVLAAVQKLGIGVEVMTTGAACRSYAILSAEGRAVAALLWPLNSP
jgi:uncharacterized protein